MSKKYSKSVHIFRRDLRLADNTALLQALGESESVLPCFIFDPRQTSDSNKYKGAHSFTFMLNSLVELNECLENKGSRLYIFSGKPEEIIKTLCEEEGFDAVYVNRDYTPFSRKRDEEIEAVVTGCGATFVSCSDLLLCEVDSIRTGQGTPYTVYSYFAKKAKTKSVDKSRANTFKNFYSGTVKGQQTTVLHDFLKEYPTADSMARRGGRKEALAILRGIADFKNYSEERNFPAQSATTGLSAHNKFGTVSIREVYHSVAETLGSSHTLISELYWRDFFTHVGFHFPHVFGKSFHSKYDGLQWKNNKKWFDAWAEGRTGYPLVDAGMRELNETGFMHNRVRMVVASFLIKDLQISWRWGERYFAQRLIDYDPSVNNGNWQWAASTGCDAQPYFRIFNPWIQQKKFDPDCLYIRKWVPELENYSPKEIHRLEKGERLAGYPEAIVDHREAKEITEAMYAEVTA